VTTHQQEKKIAVLHVTPPGAFPGGAERFVRSLAEALGRKGASVRIVEQLSDESSIESVLRSYSHFYHMDLSGFDAVISTKSPAHMVRHHNHVCYLQHTMRQFYDRFTEAHPQPTADQQRLRDIILALDRRTLRPPWIRQLYVVGKAVQSRLQHFTGLDSEVLYQGHSLAIAGSNRQNYFLMPGRLHSWKRVDLALAAMAKARTNLRLIISGSGDDEQRLRELAGLVNRGRCGMVVPPDARHIAEALDYLSEHREEAASMGDLGRRFLRRFDWETTARSLMLALWDDATP
jgi:glycosyltransferase involved in cell wall biosynthesis